MCAVAGCCVFMLFISWRGRVCACGGLGRVAVCVACMCGCSCRGAARRRIAVGVRRQPTVVFRTLRGCRVPVAPSPDSRSQLCALETFQSNFGRIRLSRVTLASNFEPHRKVHRAIVCTCTVARLYDSVGLFLNIL